MSKFTTELEIERKYIIRMPDISALAAMDDYAADEIVQTYLSSEDGVTRRVRSRAGVQGCRYYETIKQRVDGMSAIESERELAEKEYVQLLGEIAEGTSPIRKTRHSFRYRGQLFEIDVYPEWRHTAILETELKCREIEVDFPGIISTVREVTGIKGYSNAAMSRHFPPEDEL